MMFRSSGALSNTTTHDVLAGAYKGKDIEERPCHSHASEDQGETAICGRVAEGHLCDVVIEGPPTCPLCLRRVGILTAENVTRSETLALRSALRGDMTGVLTNTRRRLLEAKLVEFKEGNFRLTEAGFKVLPVALFRFRITSDSRESALLLRGQS